MRKALCSLGLLLVMVLVGGSSGAAQASPAQWLADPAKSHITVRVFKKGLFSGLAHDHQFVPSVWRAIATFDDASPADGRVEVVIAANSLRDQQPALSDEDRAKVDRQAASSDVLDATRYPEIRFASNSLKIGPGTSGSSTGALQGSITGTLALHGRERTVSVPITAIKEGQTWRARGTVNFKQSDFGIRPYSGFAGTVAVHDQVTLEYEIVLGPAP